jgi:peptidoglycan/xylan/chitin deacetylase (PgdA/CDA1 family)
MSPVERCLYLTFDDGPVPGPTEFALEQLRKFAVPATFFCIGDNISKHPHVFRDILERGHAIGNHTVNHRNGWKTGVQEYVSNTNAFDAIAKNAGLVTPTRLFRPPYGRITQKQVASLSQYRIVMWDVLSQDYNQRLSPEKCLQKTIHACRPGSIVVFHDSYKAQRNMEYALPRLIEHFGAAGYCFKTIPYGVELYESS